MEVLSPELLARCAAIASSTWSDALDTLGIEGVVRGITQRAGQGRIVGEAVTARHVSGKLGDFDKADFAVGRLVAATAPGKVLVVDVGGQAISTFGGIASTAAAMRGATAVLIDGACRDVDEIRAAGLWLASRHVSPVTGKTRLRLQEMGAPVVLGGVRVQQGDVVIGDDTGIVVVPRGQIQRVLEAAEELLAVDERVEKGVRAGVPFAEAAAKAGYIPNKTSQG
ncbi:demethylmenaquinone methyltransferase [Bordetella genomosp. 9]|uniref:RraA family protein n=1 Tax=Bordetella genomosp. 9 TaxID=1416803 RepID=UPI000A29308B|nr:RraA family protein [Bordetella genomosp. 9]ARP91820.1 demethylmenaquinone methyltransferase [Bordetella genomosp. 9]